MRTTAYLPPQRSVYTGTVPSCYEKILSSIKNVNKGRRCQAKSWAQLCFRAQRRARLLCFKLLIGAAVCSGMCLIGAERYVIGVTLVRPASSCPLFVTYVDTNSPARRAGVHAGDRLISINGTPVIEGSDLVRLVGNSATPMILEIARGDMQKQLTISPEPESVLFKKRGFRFFEGHWWPRWMTEQDVQYRERLDALLDDRSNLLGVAFAFDHYPKDLTTYYPGFEVFVTKNPGPVIGGMEHGPASRAGLRSGDVLISINGVAAAGLRPETIERLLSSTKPERTCILVKRVSMTKQFRFRLERADRVLSRSGLQVLDGQKFPASIPASELRCSFLDK